MPEYSQTEYIVETNGQPFNEEFLLSELHIDINDDSKQQMYQYAGKTKYLDN